MCKYCEMESTDLGDVIEESSNTSIMALRDGSQLFELILYRYRLNNKTKDSHLVLDYTYINNNGVCGDTIKRKKVKIKYCPFCGEKL